MNIMGKSARIKRREACKTGEVKPKEHWVKSTKYGDYTNPLDNKKYPEGLHFTNAKDHDVKIMTAHHQILLQARKLGTHGRHIGSKPFRSIVNAIATINKKNQMYMELLKKLKEEEKAREASKD